MTVTLYLEKGLPCTGAFSCKTGGCAGRAASGAVGRGQHALVGTLVLHRAVGAVVALAVAVSVGEVALLSLGLVFPPSCGGQSRGFSCPGGPCLGAGPGSRCPCRPCSHPRSRGLGVLSHGLPAVVAQAVLVGVTGVRDGLRFRGGLRRRGGLGLPGGSGGAWRSVTAAFHFRGGCLCGQPAGSASIRTMARINSFLMAGFSSLAFRNCLLWPYTNP